jgi:hypothetical protein
MFDDLQNISASASFAVTACCTSFVSAPRRTVRLIQGITHPPLERLPVARWVRLSSLINLSCSPLSFPAHPLSYVLGAMDELHAAGLTGCQETNHIGIDEGYFFEVQDKLWSVRLELVFQFFHVH